MKNIHISPSPGSEQNQMQIQFKIDKLATQLASETIEAFKKFPDNLALHQQTLIDLKQKVTDSAAELEEGDSQGHLADRGEILWSLALHLPDFNTDSLYQKRSSLSAIALAIVLGWLLGGIAATLLGFIGLGGEILRPLAIFAFIWLGEWFSSNPGARRIALTALGLGGLVRFASLVVGGMFRFTGFAALRQAIFGSIRPNIFKGFWLTGGAVCILIFFSKKISGVDLPAFRQSLQTQLEQRLNFLYFTLKEFDVRDERLNKLSLETNSPDNSNLCPRDSCSLATAVMDIMASLDSDSYRYLRSELESVGFSPRSEENAQEYFIWNSEVHSQLYETIGIVRNGDRCRILKAPYTVDGKIVRGHAQRAS